VSAHEIWTYTFTDARTNEELAVLPLTGVSFDRTVSGVGSLSSYVHLADAKVRALDPWSATIPRRSALYVERRGTDGVDRCVWGGVVNGRQRSHDSEGMTLNCVTWEGWLHRQRLLADLSLTGVGPAGTAAAILARVQQEPGGDVGIEVPIPVRDGTRRDHDYLAREVKPVLELLEDLATEAELPVEFRVDCFRGVDGRFRRVLRVAEPRLGRRWEATRLTYSYPEGGLESWSFIEDGTNAANVMPLLGAGAGDLQPFDVLYDHEAGVDEIASGFPAWMFDFRSQDTEDLDLIRSRGKSAMRGGIAGQSVFSGVAVDADRYLGLVDPGDDVGLEVEHLSFPDAGPVVYLTRVLGESVTVADGGGADAVTLTVGGAP
jgi:hypothetical protein